MMGQLFLTEPKRNPQKIILDTREPLRCLFIGMASVPYLQTDEKSVLELVLTSLFYEKDAVLELSYMCFDISKDNLYTTSEEDAIKVAEAIYAFGQTLFGQLQALRAYQNGYLYYQFSEVLERDIILSRLEVEAPQ